MFAIGVASALVASVLFNVGVALQGLEARATSPKLGLRLSLLGQLFRRPRWIIGLVLGFVGIGPQVVALSTAPFVVVQPALSAGLLVLLFIGARSFGEDVGPTEIVGVVAIIGGVALVAWGAPPHSETHRGAAAAIAVVAALSVAGLAPFLVRGRRWDSPMLSIVASGAGFAATNVATKLMSDDLGGSHYPGAVIWAAVGFAMGVAATVTGMTAFQRRRATIVVPVSTAVQTFLPIVFEPVFLQERWASATGYGVPIAVGLLVALVGTVLISRTRAVSRLAAGAQARRRPRRKPR